MYLECILECTETESAKSKIEKKDHLLYLPVSLPFLHPVTYTFVLLIEIIYKASLSDKITIDGK